MDARLRVVQRENRHGLIEIRSVEGIIDPYSKRVSKNFLLLPSRCARGVREDTSEAASASTKNRHLRVVSGPVARLVGLEGSGAAQPQLDQQCEPWEGVCLNVRDPSLFSWPNSQPCLSSAIFLPWALRLALRSRIQHHHTTGEYSRAFHCSHGSTSPKRFEHGG